MVVAVTGNFNEQSLSSQVQDLFNFGTSLKTSTPAFYTGSAVKIQNDFLPDSHAAVALRGPPAGSRDSIGIQLLLALLGDYDVNAHGGKAVESHFVASLASDKGTYKARPFFRSYRDVSLFGVYGHVEYDTLWNFVHAVLSHFTRPLHGLTEAEFNRAKSILVTRLAEKRTNGIKKNHYLSQNALYNSPTLEETIKSFGHKELADIVDRYAYDTDPALAAFGNMQYFPDYHFVRNWTYPKTL
jgi:predicted Zn-dependent peptidase